MEFYQRQSVHYAISVQWLLVALLLIGVPTLISSADEYDFTGRFRMTSSRSYDELLKTLGVGYFKRLAASKASPEFVISRNEAENTYTVRILNPFSRTSFTFSNGTEFTGISPTGKAVKSMIGIEGTKWSQRQFSDPEVLIVREFQPLEVKITTTANGITANRVFRKVSK